MRRDQKAIVREESAYVDSTLPRARTSRSLDSPVLENLHAPIQIQH